MIGLTARSETIAAMLASMAHRGPDAAAYYRIPEGALLHSRLAIIDLEGGKQPMRLSWAGETYVLVYNGELYNTEELRYDLVKAGHLFLGHSDTEVVLHAYAEYGESCVNRFNGIFAFAVWEEKGRRLFLARDRIGVKPLFYMRHEAGLLFASEIKTILAYPTVRAELDSQGAAQLLLLGPGRIPGSGVLRNIFEVEPGCCGIYRGGRLSVWKYWKLRDREHRESFEETSECVRYLVTDAIRRQMVSDVPIGTFLSGGLDSSIITAVCARELAQRGQRLPTFSVDYENNERYFRANKFQPAADQTYIELMREHFNTHHHRTLLTPEDLVSSLEAATCARDLPGMADVDFSLLAFCGQIRKKVRVALSGECADEIFGGYPWFRDPEVRARQGFPWAQNTRERAQLLLPGIVEDAHAFVMDAYSDTCRQSDILPGNSPEERRMKEMVNLNFRWFMQTLLDRKDRMSMQHGLEVRVPFCDYRIAEYLYGVPWELKDWQGREKGLLRHAVEDLLPKEVLYRKKSPYPKTFDPRYEALVEQRLNTLMRQDSPLWALVRKDALKSQLSAQTDWPWYGQLMRRPQTMAYFLQLDFWLKRYKIDIRFDN